MLRLTLRTCRRPGQRCTASPGRPRTATACPAGLTTPGADAAGTSGPHHSQRYPKRLTLDLCGDDRDALLGARYADRLPIADLIRALVSLWRETPALAEAVSIRVQELLPPPPGPSAAPTGQAHTEDGPPAS